MRIKQGDAYNIDIKLTTSDGDPVTVYNSEVVEVSIGPLRKTCPGEIATSETVIALWPGDDFEWESEEQGAWARTASYAYNRAVSPNTATLSMYIPGPSAGVPDAPDFSCFCPGDVVSIYSKEASGIHADFNIEKARVHAVEKDSSYARLIIDVSYPAGLNTIDDQLTDVTVKRHETTYSYPLSQRDTFGLAGTQPIEARVKFGDETVVGTSLGVVVVEESQSKEVL